MTEEPTILTGTGPGGLDYRIVLGVSDTGRMVAAIRVGTDPRLIVAHPTPITDAATAYAVAAVSALAEQGQPWHQV